MILKVGGATLAESFIKLGLIDEFRLYKHPVVLGAGTLMFPENETLRLNFKGSQTFDCGVTLLRYESRES